MNIVGEISIIGDTHGANGAIHYWIRNSDTPNLLHVGDDGSGFSDYEKENIKLGNRLNEAGKRLFIVRGNHCDPSLFDNRIYGGEHGGVHLLKDGTILNWNDEKILFNGGGLSLDRSSRIEGVDYWENEPFKFVEVDEKIDHLVTHISLTEIHNQRINNGFVLGWATRDACLVTDLHKEQQELNVWIDYLLKKGNNIKTWHYGHYHRSIRSVYLGIKCMCLGINEIQPFNRNEYENDF